MKSSRSKIITTKNTEDIVGPSIDDCAKLCIDKVGQECLTFGYCYLSSDCVISTNSFAQYGPGDISSDDHCDIYESKHGTTIKLVRTPIKRF